MDTEIKINEETKTLILQAEQIANKYQIFTVISDEQYIQAFNLCKEIKNKHVELENKRKEITIPLDEAKKKIMDLFRKPLEILANAERIIKNAALIYQQMQEKKRIEEEKRLIKLQEKEAERLRLRAEKAQEKGKFDKAEELKEQAEQIINILPTARIEIPEIEGVSTKTTWRYKIIDINQIPREYLIPNDEMLNKTAIATKGTLQIPGIEFYSQPIISVRK